MLMKGIDIPSSDNTDCRREETYDIPEGTYFGSILVSKYFKDKRGYERFILKINVDSMKEIFVSFVPLPLSRTSGVGAELLYLIDNDFEIAAEDLIGQRIEFTVKQVFVDYRQTYYSNITYFHLVDVDLPPKETLLC